jgi:hypothetical protein
MSDIVAVLNEIVERHDCSHPAIVSKASAEITRLTAEVAMLQEALDEAQQAFALESYNAERLRAALRECEAELNAYYRGGCPAHDNP